MRTLTEVFAPGAPTLPEGLRTLAVSPDRELEPGMTVSATFTFRNQGGAPATGVRVRFNVPDGLVYLVGSGKLDGVELDDEQGNSPLIARAGADIGNVMPGEERRIDINYSVVGAIENGSTIELQAAVASFEVPPVGSNVVRLIARSRPLLENALTNLRIEARRDAAPGAEAQILLRIHNAGESSAHDVVVVAPIPEHTSYVPNSVRANGREIERELGSSFDRVHAPVIVANLAASATATLLYRVRIDDPLADGTTIGAHARVASQETAAFDVERACLTVASEPDFSDDRTSFAIEPGHDVQPGSRLVLRLLATNGGTAPAESVSASLELPEHVLLSRGASRIDGRPVRERKKEQVAFELGRIDKHESVELVCEAVVSSPLPHGETLPIALQLAWEPHRDDGQRRFEQAIAVRSEPYMPPRRNTIARASAEVVHPGDELEAAIGFANDGSAALTDAVLRLHTDPGLEEVRVYEKSARITLEGDSAEIGTIDPYGQRKLSVRARVRSPYADRSELRLGASLHSRELGEVALGDAMWRVDSHPTFSTTTSRLELATDAVLRPNQLADAFVRVRNDGSDTAHNVRMRLYVSPEARLESVDGATRERSTIAFGEIAPGASLEARLGLRLLRGLAKTYPVTVDAVLTADAMMPVPLERMTIETTAEPDFSVGTFRCEPADAVDVGEMIEWTLHVRNGGDGPARRVRIRIEQPSTLIYVPNSTTVNDVPVRDLGALPAFAQERGIVFNDVDPGIEASIRWRDVVHNGLPAGESIARVAHVSYDGDRTDDIAASDLHVRATATFANTIPGLPFGVDGMLGPAFAGGRRALTEEKYVQLPAATPVDGQDSGRAMTDGEPRYLALDGSNGHAYVGNVSTEIVGTIVAFAPERLARTLRLLDETRFDGLVRHLFALRAFFPDAIGDAHGGALAAARDQLRETLDRMFIRLRLPNYSIAARDLETPSSRSSLVRFLSEASSARGTPAEPATASLILRGSADPQILGEFAERLTDVPLAAALPWTALAHTLPDDTSEAAAFREALIAALERLGDAEPTEFLDALQRQTEPELDAALRALSGALVVPR